jgi:hypothetical protein
MNTAVRLRLLNRLCASATTAIRLSTITLVVGPRRGGCPRRNFCFGLSIMGSLVRLSSEGLQPERSTRQRGGRYVVVDKEGKNK